MGQIITFYSYKGGVGRSMALANVAVLLSQKKKRVLIVDWDLEAPGLEYYFRRYLNIEKVAKIPGIINLLYSDERASEDKAVINWRDCLINFKVRGNSISLITSGKKTKSRNQGNYFSLVREFDIENYYDEKQGGDYIENLRNEWKSEYDYILIDSRTGITDFGGICTIQMPDVLIPLFGANEQSLTGTISLIQKVNVERKKMPVDRFSLIIFPIPSRFDGQAEFETSQVWLKLMGETFSEYYSNWLPESITSRDIIEITKIPYIPYFSFGEKLPVIEQGVADPAGLGFSYETIALIISNNFEQVEEILLNRGLITPQKLERNLKEKKLIRDSFYERNIVRFSKGGVDTRGMLSIVTMLGSLAALSVSMVGAAGLVLAIFDDGLANSLEGLPVKVIVLGLAFVFGWGMGLASIRGFGNLVYPMVVNLYAWACLTAVSILYLKVIQKLFMQQYDTTKFWAYVIILLSGLFVLICLHLLVEGHDLRPFAIPLLIISVLQLFVIVFRYIFTTDADSWKLAGDLTVFVIMISISALMLMHIGILSPLRDWIDGLFVNGQQGNGNSLE